MIAAREPTRFRIDLHRDHIWARLPFVVPMAVKVARDCAGDHCGDVASLVAELRWSMLDHLDREERMLGRLDARAGEALVRETFATVHSEHLAVADLLGRIRLGVGGRYDIARIACATERALYRELQLLERHIRCQIALEERVLEQLLETTHASGADRLR